MEYFLVSTNKSYISNNSTHQPTRWDFIMDAIELAASLFPGVDERLYI